MLNFSQKLTSLKNVAYKPLLIEENGCIRTAPFYLRRYGFHEFFWPILFKDFWPDFHCQIFVKKIIMCSFCLLFLLKCLFTFFRCTNYHLWLRRQVPEEETYLRENSFVPKVRLTCLKCFFVKFRILWVYTGKNSWNSIAPVTK